MSICEDVIDLTDSFTLTEHSSLADDVIIIDTDESLSSTAKSPVNAHSKPKRQKEPPNNESLVCLTNESWTVRKPGKSNKFGECPICWEELGKNPLASTKCGHVYCMKCLEKTLRIAKKCPSCRTYLKDSTAYHPLYLNPH